MKFNKYIHIFFDRFSPKVTSAQSSRDEPSNGNQIINHPQLNNAEIIFNGSNNILYCETPDIIIKNCTLKFDGDNSIIFLSKSRFPYKTEILMHNDSVVYIGRDNFFNGVLRMITSEQKNIIIGDSGLFSFGCWIRTADPHLVYSSKTKTRINPSRSVLIGDHVWIGQNVIVLKGSRVGSGAIVGAGSVVSGKILSSNGAHGGNPAKLIKSDVFFLGTSVHPYTDKQTQASEKYEHDDYIYEQVVSEKISLDYIDRKLSPHISLELKLDFLKKTLSQRKKNRFFLSESKPNKPKASSKDRD